MHPLLDLLRFGRARAAHLGRPRTLARRATIFLAMAAGVLWTTPARAASLSGPISGWASGVPSYISMYEYVPAKLATNPPILVVSHYCGGTAAGVFGEAQGGGIVAAADQYGFLMIFPQTTNNCWDVGTTKSLTHDGGGDTQAVAEMVTYEISKRDADASRVYATGTSSGAMMTEALLAVYPDVFKAGAEFSGVPAGCWSVSDSNGQWSSPCADGQVTNTAAQWGTMVRAMDPGYSGYRPRIQLWHGTADATINYENQLEAIKEWTDVLGLPTDPTSTDSLTFNGHSWTRQSWTDSCGITVLDAWAEQNGPHGTDANLNATYVIPFLALDKTGPDPQVASCADAGSSEAGSVDAGSSADGGTATDGSGATDASSGSNDGESTGPDSGAVAEGGSGSTDAGPTSADSSAVTVDGAAGGGAGEAGSEPSGSTDGGPSPADSPAGCGCRVPPMDERGRTTALAAACLLGVVLSLRHRRRRG